MLTEPIVIDGLAGPVSVDINTFTGKHSILVGAQRLAPTRNRYRLPTADGGSVEATLNASFLNPYPVIDIAGVKHRTGPALPLFLQIIALAPVVLLVGGLLGGLLGGTAIVVNLMVARSQLHTAVKAVAMVGILTMAAFALLILGTMLKAATA